MSIGVCARAGTRRCVHACMGVFSEHFHQIYVHPVCACAPVLPCMCENPAEMKKNNTAVLVNVENLVPFTGIFSC